MNGRGSHFWSFFYDNKSRITPNMHAQNKKKGNVILRGRGDHRPTHGQGGADVSGQKAQHRMIPTSTSTQKEHYLSATHIE